MSVELINELELRPRPEGEVLPAIARVIAVDPPSVARLTSRDIPGFIALARRLREVFDDVHRGDIDSAAARLNALLARHPAYPHLAKEGGRWRLHHHPAKAGLVSSVTSICAEGIARMIGTGHAARLGTCADTDCDRVYVDVSKNASRRFCSTTCQNRAKTAAFRLRQTARQT